MLVDAALRCLAREGIQGFTVDRISREAGVSRGLISHYFDGKDGLLVEVYRNSLYRAIHARMEQAKRSASARGATPSERLRAILEVTFETGYFSREQFRVWLALWGEIASNRALAAAHREAYATYRGRIGAEVGALAAERGLTLDAERLALAYLALVDGLWLEWCLDPTVIDREGARAAALAMLEAELGPLGA